MVMADGPDGPLPDPAVVTAAAGIDDAEVLLGWVVREPAWLKSTPFVVSTFLTGPGTRAGVALGKVRNVPVRLSAMPGLLAGRLRPDVIVVGAHESGSGWTLAHSPGFVASGVANARKLVVERWPGKPRPGYPSLDGTVHEVIDRVDPSDPMPTGVAAAKHARISELVSSLVPEGATVQWGSGVVGSSVVASLVRPVQVRSGLVTEELCALARSGLLIGRAEAAYVWGGEGLQQMIGDGTLVLRGVEKTHDLTGLSTTEGFVAINTALEVGLDGCANVEIVGSRVVAGAGGHPDFSAGASRSPGGLSIVALPSTSKGRSNVVATPEVVTTPRSDVDVIVTEYGIADLRGATLDERRDLIIGVAAPQFRDELRRSTLPDR